MVKKEGWINIYKTEDGKIFPGSIVHNTKEEAIDLSSGRQIDTIKITWEG